MGPGDGCGKRFVLLIVDSTNIFKVSYAVFYVLDAIPTPLHTSSIFGLMIILTIMAKADRN